MGIYDGNVATTVSSSPSAIGYAWASVAASAGKAYQLLGFSGGASNIACAVGFRFGSSNKLRLQSTSGSSISEWYGELGPVAAENQGISVYANNTASLASSAKFCWANLLYRVVL